MGEAKEKKRILIIHIYDVCRHNHTFAVSFHDLQEWLTLKGMVPFGLETLLVGGTGRGEGKDEKGRVDTNFN